MTLDRMLFLVVSDHESGPIIWEVELSQMDRATVAKDIRDGQYADVLHVIEFNPVEHICREVTREFEGLTRFDRELADAQSDYRGAQP
jgi:hypothetical protein